MAFSSMTFLFGFLPVCLLCYFVIPSRSRKGRNLVLLAFSLAFYCWGGIRLLPAFLVSCVLNWGAALLTVCDLISRVVFAPYELPVGIVLALVGGPFFIWLLLRQRGGRIHD